MARYSPSVDLTLDTIVVRDEADNSGSAQPYLWNVFFKIDGDTVSVTDTLSLSGPPTIHTTPGSHGNLGSGVTGTPADPTHISIPATIGAWQTELKPIPLPASLSDFAEDPGGTMGVVTVLMEEDNVSDDGAEAGHRALNEAVVDAIKEIINTRSLTNREVTREEISGFEEQVKSEIKDAIRDQQNDFENAWSAINPDDTIGTEVFIFNQDDLVPGTEVEFSKRWENEGDWEIRGHLTVHPLEVTAVLVPEIAEVPRAYPSLQLQPDLQFLPPEVFEPDWPLI